MRDCPQRIFELSEKRAALWLERPDAQALEGYLDPTTIQRIQHWMNECHPGNESAVELGSELLLKLSFLGGDWSRFQNSYKLEKDVDFLSQT